MNTKLIMLAVLLLLSSCIDVIDLDIDEAAPRIVIDGKINDKSFAEVKITTSIRIKDRNEFPGITDAKVILTDVTSGVSQELSQTFPGVYSSTELAGIPGHTYHLKVTRAMDEYSATSTMPFPVEMRKLEFEEAQRFNSSENAYRLIATYNDPDTLGNNYRYVMYQNGVQSQSIFVRNDAFTNGNEVDQPIFNPDIKIVRGDVMEVELQCVDRAVFDYFNGLMLLNSDRGIAPANPETNITGGAIGYFSAYTSSRKTVTIE